MNECGTYARMYLAAEPNGLASSWDPPTNFAKLESSPNWLKNPHRLWLENKIRVWNAYLEWSIQIFGDVEIWGYFKPPLKIPPWKSRRLIGEW